MEILSVSKIHIIRYEDFDYYNTLWDCFHMYVGTPAFAVEVHHSRI